MHEQRYLQYKNFNKQAKVPKYITKRQLKILVTAFVCLKTRENDVTCNILSLKFESIPASTTHSTVHKFFLSIIFLTIERLR